MSRLVIVSNRVALPDKASSGGLAVALQAALEETGGLWFGWSGRIDEETSGNVREQQAGDIQYVTVDLSRRDHDDYYNGFANRTLWPLLHFRVDLVDYSRETYAAYRRVNALFADTLAPLLRDDDLVWIHDYHLIPLAQLAQWLQDAHTVDGIVKGLKQPDWPADPWDALHRMAVKVAQALAPLRG